MTAIIKEHSKGFLKDGREFEIIDIGKLAISSDGTIHSGTLGVTIDGKYQECLISYLGENIDYDKLNKEMRI